MLLRLLTSVSLALVLVATSVAAESPAMRRWTDKSGKFSTDAEFVEIKQDRVVLKKANGKTVAVPLDRLSDVDREYLKTLVTADVQPANNGDVQPNLVFPDAMTYPPSWNDADAPFDVAAFLKAPPPEENAAPRYLEALYEFQPGDMVDLLYPDLTLEEKKQRWESYRARRDEQQRLEEAWEKDPKSVDGEEVDAWLSNFDVGFSKLAAAQQRPTCMFQTGRSLASLWPHAQAPRQVGRVILWQTRRDTARSDVERPLQNLKALLRLSRDLRVRGGMAAQFVAHTLDDRCCELVELILNVPTINLKQCDRMMALLVDHRTQMLDPFIEGNRAEYITARQALHELQHRTGSFDPKFLKDEWQMSGDTTSPLACMRLFTDLMGFDEKELPRLTARFQAALLPGAWQGGKLLSDENYDKEVEAVNRFYKALLAVTGKPDDWRAQDAAVDAADAAITDTILAGFVVTAQAAVVPLIRRTEARQRGTQCLIALRRWQLQHADAPPDLATIVEAANLPRVPIDPYSGQPFRMAMLNGNPVIYSIGPDGTDDKAQIKWDLMPGKPGDFIFSLQHEK